MTIDGKVKAQYDHDVLKSESQYDDDRLLSAQYDNDRLKKWWRSMITIDWQVKAQYDDDRLKSESAKW